MAKGKTGDKQGISKDTLQRLYDHVYAGGLLIELACDAEGLGDGWRQQMGDDDLRYLRKAEALFVRDKIDKLLSQPQHANAVKVYLERFGKAFDKRRQRIEYIVVQFLTAARRHVPADKWDEFLDDLKAQDTEDTVRRLDEPLLSGGD